METCSSEVLGLIPSHKMGSKSTHTRMSLRWKKEGRSYTFPSLVDSGAEEMRRVGLHGKQNLHFKFQGSGFSSHCRDATEALESSQS